MSAFSGDISWHKTGIFISEVLNEIPGVELKSLGNEARRKFSAISNLQIAAFR